MTCEPIGSQFCYKRNIDKMASSSQTYTMQDSDVFGFKTVPVKNDDRMYVCDFADCNKKFKTMIGE